MLGLRPIHAVLLFAPIAAAVVASSVRRAPSALDRFDAVLFAWRLEYPPAQALVLFDAAGSIAPWIVAMAVVIVLAARARIAAAIETLVVAISAELVTAVVKYVVDRDRPDTAAVGDLLTSASYPSGHVVRAVVATGAVLLLVYPSVPRRAIAVAAGTSIVVLMAIARVAAGVHYTSDVLGGMLLGATIIAGWAVVREARPNHPRAPGWTS